MNEKNKQKEDIKKDKSLYFYIYYVILIVINLLVRPFFSNIEAVIGDFGGISPVLLTVFAVYGLKWTLIFSVVGILLTALRKYFLDVNKIYAVITGLVLLMSLIILLVI